ncbi:MAG: acyl-CoA dehydratase activase-related protein [Chloroflexota bacterium]|jgi:predicted nucleotide-binding protein (sugar kinase/HSP70/actin superfamily)
MIKVGIPRALLYYQQYPLWRTFFEELGAETVVSPKTTRGILSAGSAVVVAETCLPTKIFCGHCAALGNSVDFIFIPSVKSVEPNVYNCSKFVGLPDLVRQTGKEIAPVVDIEVDVNQGLRKVRDELHRVGKRFTRLPWKIDKALDRALTVDQQYQAIMRNGLTPPEAIEHLFPDQKYTPSTVRSSRNTLLATRELVVALIGHPYNIYDEFVNHNLIGRLLAMNIRLVTPEMISLDGLNEGISLLVGKPYFTYEREVIGAGGYYLKGGVDGIISVVAFGCGPDSLMIDLVTRAAKRQYKKPLMNITIDEHTAEAGLVTRLEAFVDMLQRRAAKQSSGRV